MRTEPARSTRDTPSRSNPRRMFFRASSGSISAPPEEALAQDHRVDRHRDEEEREVRERVAEEPPRADRRRLPLEGEGEREEEETEDERGDEVDDPERAAEHGQQRDPDEDDRVEDDRARG